MVFLDKGIKLPPPPLLFNTLIFISVASCIANIHCHQHWHVTPFVYCVLSCILFSPLERPQFCGNCFFCYHHWTLASTNHFWRWTLSFWAHTKVQSKRMEESLNIEKIFSDSVVCYPWHKLPFFFFCPLFVSSSFKLILHGVCGVTLLWVGTALIAVSITEGAMINLISIRLYVNDYVVAQVQRCSFLKWTYYSFHMLFLLNTNKKTSAKAHTQR